MKTVLIILLIWMTGSIYAQVLPATTTPLNSATNNRGNTSEPDPMGQNNLRTTESPQALQNQPLPVSQPAVHVTTYTTSNAVINPRLVPPTVITTTNNETATVVAPTPVPAVNPVSTVPSNANNPVVSATVAENSNSKAKVAITPVAENTTRTIEPDANKINANAVAGKNINTAQPVGPAVVPVLSTFVPEDVIKMIKNKYAGKVYDITRVKVPGTTHYNYMVRFRDKGVYKTEIINEEGVIIK